MNINILQSRNPYASTVNSANQAKRLSQKTEFALHEKVETTANQKANEINISNSEMKFFQKLFPENAIQIEKYLSFNRNGQITETALNKGSIIDGRI
jgi:soluble cytochrome b562